MGFTASPVRAPISLLLASSIRAHTRRGFKGFSALRFLRDARFAFLRSSLLSVLVLAMNPFLDLVIGKFVIW